MLHFGGLVNLQRFVSRILCLVFQLHLLEKNGWARSARQILIADKLQAFNILEIAVSECAGDLTRPNDNIYYDPHFSFMDNMERLADVRGNIWKPN